MHTRLSRQCLRFEEPHHETAHFKGWWEQWPARDRGAGPAERQAEADGSVGDIPPQLQVYQHRQRQENQDGRTLPTHPKTAHTLLGRDRLLHPNDQAVLSGGACPTHAYVLKWGLI